MDWTLLIAKEAPPHPRVGEASLSVFLPETVTISIRGCEWVFSVKRKLFFSLESDS